jgi:hypothetical protein
VASQLLMICFSTSGSNFYTAGSLPGPPKLSFRELQRRFTRYL